MTRARIASESMDHSTPSSTASPKGTEVQRSHPFATWLFFLGLLLPGDVTFSIGGAKFNPERLVLVVLLVPALFILLRRGRHFVVSDLFVCLASIWIVGVALQEGRLSSLSSSAAIVLELLGGYLVARAYFYERSALDGFIRAMKVAVTIIIAVAMLDHMSGKWVVNGILGLNPEPEFRYGLMRAESIFPHPIAYGTFCTVASGIFLYSERSLLSRVRWVGLCLFGCLLAMSSAPLLVFCIVISVYCYDRIMKSYAWRWKAFAAMVGGALGFIYLTTENPTSWIIAHLTLDPSTGYFRKATWDRAFYNIGQSPLTGYGFDEMGDQTDFFDRMSVDSVWLVVALRFGIPIVIFLILANVTSFFTGFGRKTVGRNLDAYMDDMRRAFTLAVMTFVLVGLTVHYWNTLWMFWGVCIGIRASLYEQFLQTRRLLEVRPAWNRSKLMAGVPAG